MTEGVAQDGKASSVVQDMGKEPAARPHTSKMDFSSISSVQPGCGEAVLKEALASTFTRSQGKWHEGQEDVFGSRCCGREIFYTWTSAGLSRSLGNITT